MFNNVEYKLYDINMDAYIRTLIQIKKRLHNSSKNKKNAVKTQQRVQRDQENRLMSKPKKLITDRSIRFDAYCGNVKDLPVNQSQHTFSPNSDADADYEYWVQYADYYQWPFVTVFDSVEDLFNKLKTLDLKQISENMRKFNKYRETDLLDNWCKILKKLPEANIPSSFQETLNYFEVNSFVK